jgi:hypothetical protein
MFKIKKNNTALSQIHENSSCYQYCGSASSHPAYCSDADPEPDHFNADPDPAYHFDADPDPTFQFQFDPDPQHCLLQSLQFEKTQTSESHLLSGFEVRLPVLELLAVALLQLLQLGRLVLHQHLPLLVLDRKKNSC